MIVKLGTNYQSLQLQLASHVNCVQRAGIVERLNDGLVYRLVPMQFYHDDLNKEIPPEIMRVPLKRLVLATKLLDLDESSKPSHQIHPTCLK